MITYLETRQGFRMISANDVRTNLEFKKVESRLITYQISNLPNGDVWNNNFANYSSKTEGVNFDEAWQ